MKEDFFNENEYYLDNIWFKYEGIAYRGNGVLTWTPEKGFHFIGNIQGDKRLDKKEFHSIDPAEKPTRMIYEIKSAGQVIKIVTPLLRIHEMNLYMSQKYSCDFGHALFLSPLSQYSSSKDSWFGSAIYETSEKLTLPDILHTEIKIGETNHGSKSSRAGFSFTDNNIKSLIGEMKDDKYLHFYWNLPKIHWTKNQNWRFAEALRDSLSIFSGAILQLRYHESHRGSRLAQEYDINGKPDSLGLVFRLFDFHFVPKEHVVKLASFLSKKSQKERIIRKIFWQLVDASKQNTIGASELLLSTILEASLRTIYNIPFVPGRFSRDDPFKPLKILKQFQIDHLTGTHDERWKKVIEVVNDGYERLRHRNAHPDWSSSEGGMFSPTAMEQSLNDMILLSRFYGYMILALSGEKDLEPKFPTKISNWKPIMIMEVKQKDT